MTTARFKYVGDPRDNFSGPEVAEHHGYRFVKGEVTDVPDEAVAKKLVGHSHFVDMSDKDAVKDEADLRKQYEKRDADKAKAEEQATKDAEARDKASREAAAKAAIAANARRGPGPATMSAEEKQVATMRTEAASPTVSTSQQNRLEEQVAEQGKKGER